MGSAEGESSVSVGFFMDYGDALEPFLFEKEEVSHEEDRFNPKTGLKVGTELVVDSEGGKYVRLPGSCEEWGPIQQEDGGPDMDGTEEFLEALGKLLCCQVEHFGDGFVGFNVAVTADYVDDSYEVDCNFSAGSSLDFNMVLKMGPRLKELAKKMKRLGYADLGDPVIYNVLDVLY